MQREEYNGWTNYETWMVNLHLTNDADLYKDTNAAADQAWIDARSTQTLTRMENAKVLFEDYLKNEISDGMPTESDLYANLIQSALDEVDWAEIADHFIGENLPTCERCDEQAEVNDDDLCQKCYEKTQREEAHERRHDEKIGQLIRDGKTIYYAMIAGVKVEDEFRFNIEEKLDARIASIQDQVRRYIGMETGSGPLTPEFLQKNFPDFGSDEFVAEFTSQSAALGAPGMKEAR